MREIAGDLAQFVMLDEFYARLADSNDLMFQPGQNEAMQIDEIAGDMQGGDHPLTKVEVDEKYVKEHVSREYEGEDLQRFIL